MGKGMATPDKGLHYSNPFSLPEAPNPFINPWTHKLLMLPFKYSALTFLGH